mmetsp:Transcript_1278/g.3471  ORF Transcript_1278/g.3471 Transcript_1278/m.3471 type:complete len:92 (-) Transcript_1278:240-515(-)
MGVNGDMSLSRGGGGGITDLLSQPHANGDFFRGNGLDRREKSFFVGVIQAETDFETRLRFDLRRGPAFSFSGTPPPLALELVSPSSRKVEA